MSDGFGWQVAAELGPDHPAVSVSPGHFAPNHAGLVGLPAGRDGVPAEVTGSAQWHTNTQALKPHPLFGLVDVGAAFAQVEVHLVTAVAALHLQQRRVLALVPQAALVAGEDGLTPQSVGHTATPGRYSPDSTDGSEPSEEVQADLQEII